MTGFNHAPVCPGASPVMFISLKVRITGGSLQLFTSPSHARSLTGSGI